MGRCGTMPSPMSISNSETPPEPAATDATHLFPRLRWVGVAWLAVYLPSYAIAYGTLNFLFLCNLGVMVTAIGLLLGSRLLVSSQAVAAPIIGLIWTTDASWRLLTGSFLFGGTAYMWDPQYPIFTRLLSLYHVAWPLLLLWIMSRVGYDRRGIWLQTAIAGASMVVARVFTDPELNINFAFIDPFWGQQIGPPVVHVLVSLGVLAGVAYGLTHWMLRRVFG